MAFNLKKQWHKYYQGLIGTEKYFNINSQIYSLYKKLRPLIDTFARGKILDLGCGDMTHREMLKNKANEYISTDKYACHPDIDVIADINSLPFKNSEFDTVFCSQVFEHISKPWVAIKEVSRVLTKNGILILTVPHLCYLHGEPEDFYRYTKYGIEKIAKEGRLNIVKIVSTGGLIAFISTPVSILFLSIFGNIKFLSGLAYKLNYFFILFIDFLDNFLDKNNIYCYNYIAILQKKDE